MNNSQMRDVSEASLTPMTEEELAQWRSDQGKHVIFHRHHYWQETIRGFYEPIHWLAKLKPEQVAHPMPFCWGFRSSLAQNEVGVANGSIPVYIMSDFQDYDLQSISANRRSQLRKCRKQVKIVELTDTALLQEQGYQVLLSSAKRVGLVKVPSQQQYLANLAHYKHSPSRLILAGIVGDRLGGYLTCYTVNDTAYIEYLYVDTEVLTTNISLGLTYDAVQICRHSPNIKEIVHGLHRREDSSLSLFKERIGFTVKYIPSIVRLNPIIAKFLNWRYPHQYYRLTGHI